MSVRPRSTNTGTITNSSKRKVIYKELTGYTAFDVISPTPPNARTISSFAKGDRGSSRLAGTPGLPNRQGVCEVDRSQVVRIG